MAAEDLLAFFSPMSFEVQVIMRLCMHKAGVCYPRLEASHMSCCTSHFSVLENHSLLGAGMCACVHTGMHKHTESREHKISGQSNLLR